MDGQTFYIDLLFCHVRLHCYLVFDLKTGAFQPEHAGKLGCYLAAVNRTMRIPVEGPSIGVLLCESRSGPIVEFALESTNQPIAVSTYQVTRELPAPMQEELQLEMPDPGVAGPDATVKMLSNKLTQAQQIEKASVARGRLEDATGKVGAADRIARAASSKLEALAADLSNTGSLPEQIGNLEAREKVHERLRKGGRLWFR